MYMENKTLRIIETYAIPHQKIELSNATEIGFGQVLHIYAFSGKGLTVPSIDRGVCCNRECICDFDGDSDDPLDRIVGVNCECNVTVRDICVDPNNVSGDIIACIILPLHHLGGKIRCMSTMWRNYMYMEMCTFLCFHVLIISPNNVSGDIITCYRLLFYHYIILCGCMQEH